MNTEGTIRIEGKVYVKRQTLAKILKVNIVTIANWVDHYGLPCLKIGAYRLFVLPEVVAWMEQHKTGQAFTKKRENLEGFNTIVDDMNQETAQ
jgi:phage terminase Nu1 subunit (DNA packaging protein)